MEQEQTDIGSAKHLRMSDVLVRNSRNRRTIREKSRAIQMNRFLESFCLNATPPRSTSTNRRIRLILEAVFRNRNVRVIRFDSPVWEEWFPIEAFGETESLQELHFTTSSESAILGRIFRANRRVQTIKLASLQAGDFLIDALTPVLRYRSLRSLHVVNCLLSEECLTALGNALRQYSLMTDFVYRESELEGFLTTINDDCAQVWATAIERSQALSGLELNAARFSAVAVMRILESLAGNQSIRDLLLGGIERWALGEEGSLAVARLINENYTLERLTLNGYSPNLLIINDEYFSRGLDYAPISRALVVNESLKYFALDEWAIRPTSLDNVYSAGRYNRTLEVLEISNCHIKTSEDFIILCRFLSQFAALKEVKLVRVDRGLGPSVMNNDVAAALCESLQQMEYLERLSLEDCHLGNDEVSILSRFLAGNESLIMVSLKGICAGGGNSITGDGYASFGRALETNKTLKSILLPSNRSIGQYGLRQFLNGVKVHPSLEECDIGCSLERYQREELDFYLDRNKRFRPLLSARCLWVYGRKFSAVLPRAAWIRFTLF